MSDVAIFAIGGVLFVITTGATIAFLLKQVMAAHRRELLESDAISHIEEDRFTELHIYDDESKVTAPAGIDDAGGSLS